MSYRCRTWSIGLPKDGCGGEALVAYDPRGVEVARLDQPPYAGDEWILDSSALQARWQMMVNGCRVQG